MRRLAGTIAILAVVAVPQALAKDGVVAHLENPTALRAPAGTTISLVWTLRAGKQPFDNAMAEIAVRKWVTFTEEIHHEGGESVDEPLVKAAVAAVIPNPYAGSYSDELDELVEPSGELGRVLVARCVQALGGRDAE